MIELRIPLHPKQKQILNHSKRYNVIVCHRRFGKTVLELAKLIKCALETQEENARFAYIAPFYIQAKNVAWSYLRSFLQDVPNVKFNESELRADLPNGARIQLLGADNPDRLRGMYLHGCVLDEVADMSPRIWGEVIFPLLQDKGGWCDFIGTPKGMNLFYDLYQSAKDKENWSRQLFRLSDCEKDYIKDLEVYPLDEFSIHDIRVEYQDKEDEYQQEFECSWSAAIKGSYYGKVINKIEQDGRIGNYPYDPQYRVDTWWDLGIRDSTAIWFVQHIDGSIRVIDFYEHHGEGLDHYAKVLDKKDYLYGLHIAPHDIKVKEFGSGVTRIEQAKKLGIKFKVAPNIEVAHGIDVVRSKLRLCYFNETNEVMEGLNALRLYRCDYDEKNSVFRQKPLHNFASNAADAFRYGCITKPDSGLKLRNAEVIRKARERDKGLWM